MSPAVALPRPCAGAVSPVLAASCPLPLTPALAWGSLPHGWWDIHAGSPWLGLRHFLCLCFCPHRSCSFLLLHGDSAAAQPQAWAQLPLLPSRGRALHGARQAVGPGTPRAQLILCLAPPVPHPLLLPTPALQTLPPCSAWVRRCGVMRRGLCAGVRGWSLRRPCWLGTGCRVAAPPRGWGRPRVLAGAEQLGECLACAPPGSSWLCLWAAGTGWRFRHLPVALVAWMSSWPWHCG